MKYQWTGDPGITKGHAKWCSDPWTHEACGGYDFGVSPISPSAAWRKDHSSLKSYVVRSGTAWSVIQPITFDDSGPHWAPVCSVCDDGRSTHHRRVIAPLWATEKSRLVPTFYCGRCLNASLENCPPEDTWFEQVFS